MFIHSFSKHTEFSGVEEKMEIVKNEYLKMYFSTVFSYFPPLIDHQRLFKSTKTAVIAVLLLSHSILCVALAFAPTCSAWSVPV